jgi:hypothetical protein
MSTTPSTLQQQYQQYLAQLSQPGAMQTGDQSYNPTESTPSSPYASSSYVNAGPYGNPYATTTPGLTTSDTVNNSNFYNDQSIEYAQENQLQGEAEAQLGYYGPLQEQAQQQEEASLDQLNAQPGYTPGQASQINVNYGQYNTPTSALQSQFLTPGEQSSITGDPNAPVQTMTQGTNAEGQMLNQYQSNLGGQLANADTWTGNAVGGLQTGLDSAQSDFSGLNSAVSNPNLAFNANGAEQEITPAEEQQMVTAAGTTVGNQYAQAEQQLQQSAANAGNTSPLAIAAANARLVQQGAATAGDVENQASIAALQAQEAQATSMSEQSQAAAQYQSGLQAQASTTEEQAAQNAAALAGTQNISAAEEMGQEGLNAANQYGQFSTSTEGNIANQQYGAESTAEQEASSRAAELATNRQATQEGVNATQYAQGTGSAQLTAGGAENVGQTAIAGENTYRSGVAQQQALAQQGGQTAESNQQTAASTLGSQLNTSEANAGAFKNNSPTLAGQSSQVIGAVSNLLDEGGIVTEPTTVIIGEKRPEMVIPIGPRYRPNYDRSAA